MGHFPLLGAKLSRLVSGLIPQVSQLSIRKIKTFQHHERFFSFLNAQNISFSPFIEAQINHLLDANVKEENEFLLIKNRNRVQFALNLEDT